MDENRRGVAGAVVLTEQMLARARAGDEAAFDQLVAPYRREIQLHCYRILGSLQDAEDMLQETLLAAWRGLPEFQAQASLRSWLYRIATNRCLNALRDRRRRPPLSEPIRRLPEPSRRNEPVWIEPYPDLLIDGIASTTPGPDVRYETREAIGLAFIAALQRLPPRQRVILVLRDVLGYRRAEVATMLGTTEASVKAGLQRARTTLDASRPALRRDAPAPRSPREHEVIGRFVAALEGGDIEGVVRLLTEDAWLTMPPEPHEYQGHAAIAGFLHHRAPLLNGHLRLVATRANGEPAFGCYLPGEQADVLRGYGFMSIALDGDLISAITWFSDRNLFPYFGFPPTLAGDPATVNAGGPRPDGAGRPDARSRVRCAPGPRGAR